jgi:hypothetical protein
MDRRRFERFKINNFAVYKPGRINEKELMTNNISLKGACFFSEKELKPNKIIMLKFYFGPKVGSKQVKSRVVYSMSVKDDLGQGYLNGVEFLDLIFKDDKELKENEY